MQNRSVCAEYSQLRREDCLLENRLEVEGKARVYSESTMFEKEGDSAEVVDRGCNRRTLERGLFDTIPAIYLTR